MSSRQADERPGRILGALSDVDKTEMRRISRLHATRGFESTLARAKRGEGAALRALYDSVAGQVKGYANGQGADDPDALANETLYRALGRIDEFEGDETGFRSWVFTIAHNLVIDDRRRQSRRPARADDDVVDLGIDPESPESVVLSSFGAEDLVRAVHELTDAQRDVVLLRTVADLSLDQVASLTGRPVGAVKALQHRGLASLRRNLAVSETGLPTFTTTT